MRKIQNKSQILKILEKELPYLREKYGITQIALYGSYAHGTPDKESDIDLLVALSRPLGLEFIDLANYLENRFGRKVDLATFDTLDRSLHLPRYQSISQNIKRTLIHVNPAG
jgi:predicted nucleotidyltransferase